MNSSSLEHIRIQAVIVARFTGSEDEGRLLIKEALKHHPQLIAESLIWFDLIMNGLTREQVAKWITQGYTILSNGVPIRTFDHLWDCINRINSDQDNVLVLEELIKLTDQQLADIWRINSTGPAKK